MYRQNSITTVKNANVNKVASSCLDTVAMTKISMEVTINMKTGGVESKNLSWDEHFWGPLTAKIVVSILF